MYRGKQKRTLISHHLEACQGFIPFPEAIK